VGWSQIRNLSKIQTGRLDSTAGVYSPPPLVYPSSEISSQGRSIMDAERRGREGKKSYYRVTKPS